MTEIQQRNKRIVEDFKFLGVADIAAKYNMKPDNVRRVLNFAGLSSSKKEISARSSEKKDVILKMGPTSTIKQICDAIGCSDDYARKTLRAHGIPWIIPKRTKKVKEKKPRKPKKVKAPKELSKNGERANMQKGLAKIQSNQRIFKTLHRNPSDYRSVSMFDSKNTIKQIRKDDPRTDDQIRSDWKVEQERKLRGLRD